MIKVDKGIPLPGSATGGRPRLYPWVEMGVGDSFFVEARDGDRRKAQMKVGRVASMAGKVIRGCAGRRYVTRQVDGGVRVWRVE